MFSYPAKIGHKKGNFVLFVCKNEDKNFKFAIYSEYTVILTYSDQSMQSWVNKISNV